jgi:hypothetical protein
MSFYTYLGLVRLSDGTFTAGGAGEAIQQSLIGLADYATGISGLIGTGGAGTSGYSGISGRSGASGSSGYSGFSGVSGYSGTGRSGFSGYSGAVGQSGGVGASGVTGAQGLSGISGKSGYSGWSGVASAATPTGSVISFAGSTAPSGWLLCDGSAVSRSTYSALFSVVGTTYGVGDGSTTFNVPDLMGRMPMGAGSGSGLTGRDLGTKGGYEDLTYFVDNFDQNLDGTTGNVINGLLNIDRNAPPYLVLNFIVKT